MIRVEFRKPGPPDAFDEWVARCEKAAKGLKHAADVDDKLYKEQRKAFLDLFNGKCAYCEAKIVLDQHGGDVEHFRPKGAVTDEHDQGITIRDKRGRARKHPGYYWLAYDWRNLLPACIACNRPKNLGNRLVGKWNRFPVEGTHASTPDGVAQEKPLLLNPLVAEDDPALHITYDPITGRLIPTTDRGRVTIEVLNLNREGMDNARRDVYDAVRSRILDLTHAEMDNDRARADRHMTYLLQVKRGQTQYSIAGRAVVNAYEAMLRRHAPMMTGESQAGIE